MSLKIVTGQGTTDHVTSADAGSMHAGVIGTGKYVLNLGNKFAYEVISNNLVKVKDGDLMNQGRHMRIEPNDYEECTIENGLQSVRRNDLIVVRYTRNTETQIETSTVVVIKGTSGDTAVDPTYTTGNILNGESVDDFPLYRVRLNGLNIEGVDQLFTVNQSLADLRTYADTELGKKVVKTDVISSVSDYKDVSAAGKVIDATLEKALQNRIYRKIGKNLLLNTMVNGDVEEGDGLTKTVNADKSVSLTGTVSTPFPHPGASRQVNTIHLKVGSYVLSGCPANGSTNYNITIYNVSTGNIATDNGAGVSFNVTVEADYSVSIYVKKGVTLYQETFYPQICYADAENPLVYEQYAPSNAELNSNLGAINYNVDNYTFTYAGTVQAGTDYRVDIKAYDPTKVISICVVSAGGASALDPCRAALNTTNQLYVRPTVTQASFTAKVTIVYKP